MTTQTERKPIDHHLEKVYGATTSDALSAANLGWAENYDTDVNSMGYRFPILGRQYWHVTYLKMMQPFLMPEREPVWLAVGCTIWVTPTFRLSIYLRKCCKRPAHVEFMHSWKREIC